MKTSYLRMKGDNMVTDYSKDLNNDTEIDIEGLSQEVDKFNENIKQASIII